MSTAFLLPLVLSTTISGFSQALISGTSAAPLLIELCNAASDARSEAEDALERLDDRIESMTASQEPSEAIGALRELLGSPCFLMSAENFIADPDSALSLQAWWRDGGFRWLQSYLDPLSRHGAASEIVVLPPDPRRTLTLESHSDHRLSSLLCPETDRSCGIETDGWRRRAESWFHRHSMAGGDVLRPEAPRREEACAELEKSDELRGYMKWRSCIEERRAHVVALPVGRFSAPTGGWLVVRTERYDPNLFECRSRYELSAYDLGSGAVYSADMCLCSGPIDGPAIFCEENVGTLRVRAGGVNLENLREAAWMTVLAPEVERDKRQAETFIVSAGLERIWVVDPPGPPALVSQTVTVSEGDSIAWSWIQETGTIAEGVLYLRKPSDENDYAVELLTIADASFEERDPRVVLIEKVFDSLEPSEDDRALSLLAHALRRRNPPVGQY